MLIMPENTCAPREINPCGECIPAITYKPGAGDSTGDARRLKLPSLSVVATPKERSGVAADPGTLAIS